MGSAWVEGGAQGGEHSAYLKAAGVEVLMFGIGEVAQVPREVQLTLDLGARASRDGDESPKLGTREAAKPLGDVRHHGDRGATKLVSEAEVTRERALAARLVDRTSEASGFLPHLQLLEARGLTGHDGGGSTWTHPVTRR